MSRTNHLPFNKNLIRAFISKRNRIKQKKEKKTGFSFEQVKIDIQLYTTYYCCVVVMYL